MITYTLTTDGTTVYGHDQNGMPVVDGGDGGAVLQALLPAANSAGAKIVFRNEGIAFPWGSVPALPKGITNRLFIDGGGATVRLTTKGPRFLDFARTADYDTFQNIDISDFVIDCNNVGGKHHVVLGTYVNGVSGLQRVNFANIAVRRIRTVNVPVDATMTNHRLNIWIMSTQPLASEVTANTLTDITVEDCRFEGGNQGVVIGGLVGGGSPVGLNIGYDRIRVAHCYHSCLTPQANFFSSHVQIGSHAFGGSCRVENCWGYYSGDVGIEIDNAVTARVLGCTMEDTFNANFFATNFNNPQGNRQRIIFDTCASRRISALNPGSGFYVTINNSIALGELVLRNCSHYRNATDMTSSNGDAIYVPSGTTLDQLIVEGFSAVADNMAYASSSNQTHTMILVSTATAPTVPCRVSINRSQVTMAGSRTGSGVYTIQPFQLCGKLALDVDDLSLNINVSNLTSAAMRMFEVGLTTSTIGGTIRRVKVLQAVGDVSSRGFQIRGTATLTVSPWLEILGCDLSALAAGQEVFFVDATNKPFLRLHDNTYHTAPAPAGMTGLVSGTGGVIGNFTSAKPALATFAPGSGAGITAIDYSTNGGTTYTNLLTQASAALPAGPSLVVGPLESDGLIRVTFATTQPTITLVPVRP